MAGILMGDDNPLNALIGKSAAEKALQPWWESIEDLLIYGLIGFGRCHSNRELKNVISVLEMHIN